MRKYFSIGNVICGIVAIGCLIGMVAVFGEASMNIALIEDAIVVPGTQVLAENDGKIVLVSGRITNNEFYAFDDTFEVEADSPILKRSVDMYQWVKYTRDDEDYYTTEWSNAKPIVYSDNPRDKPYQDKMSCASVWVGEYELSPEIVAKLEPHGEWTRLRGLSGSVAARYGMEFVNDTFYIYNDLDNEYVDVGDTRIQFETLNISRLGDITILARQDGHMLNQHTPRENVMYPLGNIYSGRKTLEEVLKEEEGELNFAKWVFIILTLVFALLTALLTWMNVKYYVPKVKNT